MELDFLTEPLQKSNTLNCYYASIFSSEGNNTEIQSTDSGKQFTININVIRKQSSAIENKKSVGQMVFLGKFWS
jgi:hypothetical protein